MIGAILGDMVGAPFEFKGLKTKDFPFPPEDAAFTDDTVLTVAVADALLHNLDPVQTLQKWGRRYRHCSWGNRFRDWLFSDNPRPYNSYGNGAAMRVSPAGLLARTPEEALTLADRVTAITHNHPEGLKGARATALAIFLFRQGESVDSVRETLQRRFGYNLARTVDEIRPGYRYNETCQHTVPEALICAFEAVDVEDAIRNAVSLGGDADTLAAIAGAVAEARFGGVPYPLARWAFDGLDAPMQRILEALYRQAQVPPPWEG